MSPKRARRLVPKVVAQPVVVSLSEASDPISASVEAAWEETWEWEEEPPREVWSEWRVVNRVEDRDPTYTPEYAGHILFPLIRSLNPRRKVTVTCERKLGRFWTDRYKGPMGEVVRTETRVERY